LNRKTLNSEEELSKKKNLKYPFEEKVIVLEDSKRKKSLNHYSSRPCKAKHSEELVIKTSVSLLYYITV